MNEKKITKHFRKFFAAFVLVGLAACSVELFNDFYVVSVSIQKNGALSADKEAIEVVFSKEVDQKSAEDTIRVEGDASGEMPMQHQVSGDTVRLIPKEPWPAHERFWLIVPKETEDVYGKTLGEDYYHPFQSTERLLPVSALLVSPRIISGVVSGETQAFEIEFSAPVDRESVEREFSTWPALDGYFEWRSDTSLVYRLLDGLQRNSFYSIQIKADAKDQNGYDIKPFIEEFEYFPNQIYPEVSSVYADTARIFHPGEHSTYTVENGCYVITCIDAEKDTTLRIDFSTPINRSTFKENVQISPYAGWSEQWQDDSTVLITFDENLELGAEYELFIGNPIEDMYGMRMQYDYRVHLIIDGVNSQFLEFYVDDFLNLEVDAELTGSGIVPVQNVENGIDDEGYYIEITYDDPTGPAQITIALGVTLRFNHPLDVASLQDSVSFGSIFEPDPNKSGRITDFQWNGTNDECKLRIEGMGDGSISSLSIAGGKNGVIDENGNYMKQNIEYYFKVKLNRI